MRFPKRIVSSLFGFLIVFCVAQVNAQSVGDLSHVTNVDSLFTQAQIALNMERNIPKATELFNRIVELQPGNAVAFASLSAIYQGNQNYTKALQEIKSAVLADPGNSDYQTQLAILLAQTGNYLDAVDIFKRLAENSDNPDKYLLKIVWLYKMADKYKEALKVMSEIKIDSLDKEQFLLDKLKLYAHLNNIDSVNLLAHQLIKLAPDKPEYYTIVVFSEEQKKNFGEMLQLMDTAIKRFPKNPRITQEAIILYAKYSSDRLNTFYNDLIENDIYTPKEKAILFYPLLDLKKNSNSADRILREKLPQLAFGSPVNEYAIYLYGAFVASEGNLDSAAVIMKKGIKLVPDDPLLWYGLLNFYNLEANTDSLQHYIQKAFSAIPQNPIPYYFQANIDVAKNNNTEGIRNLKLAHKYNAKDSLIANFNIYSFLGSIYQTTNQQDSAEVYFIKALKLEPESALVLNNYSYLLAEQNRDLNKALDMSGKSLADHPNEATFLDTYGWILYKQKRFAESKTYIEKAIRNTERPDSVLYKHLGDVESALGHHGKARKYWKKSLELENNKGK